MASADEDALDRLVLLNLAAPFKLCRQVVPLMTARGAGHIVQVSSLGAITPSPYTVMYQASKAGLSHGTAALELELRGTGVRLTTAHLGFTDTAMLDRILDLDGLDHVVRRFKMSGLLRKQSTSAVAASLVRAVRKDKRFVIHPKMAMGMAGMTNFPRRVSSLGMAGLRFR